MLGCVIISFLIYQITIKERVYYIPEHNLYVKVSHKPKDDYGYVYFAKDSNGIFRNKNYLKLQKAVDNCVLSVYLKANKDSIFYISLGNPFEIKSVDFVFIEKERLDSTLFYVAREPSLYYKVRPEYVTTFELSDFNSDIYVSCDTSIFLKRYTPINFAK